MAKNNKNNIDLDTNNNCIDFNNLSDNYHALETEYNSLMKMYKTLTDEHDALMTNYESLSNENKELKQKSDNDQCMIKIYKHNFMNSMRESIFDLIQKTYKYTDTTTFETILKKWDAGTYNMCFKNILNDIKNSNNKSPFKNSNDDEPFYFKCFPSISLVCYDDISATVLEDLRPDKPDIMFDIYHGHKNHESNEYLHDYARCSNPYIRMAVAEQGYALDILVNDESEIVRRAVAEQGYELDKLINDPSPYVRAAVAEQGYGLDILINDESDMVRISTINNSKHSCNKLIYDPSPDVRAAVALKTTNKDILKILADDDSALVCIVTAVAMKLNIDVLSPTAIHNICSTLHKNRHKDIRCASIISLILNISDISDFLIPGLDDTLSDDDMHKFHENLSYHYVLYITSRYLNELAYKYGCTCGFIEENSPYYNKYENMLHGYYCSDDEKDNSNKKPKKYVFTHSDNTSNEKKNKLIK